MILRLLLMSLLLPGMALGAPEERRQEGRQLLFSMSQALHQLNYRGTFTYRRNDQMQGIEIIHGVEGEREFERMVTLNGPTREIVRDGDKVRCEFQQDDPFMVDQSSYPRPFVLADAAQLKDLERFYQVTTEQSGPIAGFSSQKVALMPRDPYRYGYRFWVSSNVPHLLLRSEMVGGDGEILEQLLFTSLEVLNSPPVEFAAIKSKATVRQNLGVRLPELFNWQVVELPPGYRHESKRFSNMHSEQQEQRQVEHHLFGDGFSSVSLFIESLTEERDRFQPIASQMGAVSLVTYRLNGHKIVVVGEVPLATARLIAHSVKRSD